MKNEIGIIKAIFRYPVKSMAGMEISNSKMGFHGLEGDRRFAFRRVENKSGFPFLTASKLPEMILFKPFSKKENDQSLIPGHVCTPEGKVLELQSNELSEDISQRYGSEVQLMHFDRGIFDEASISLISNQTILKIEKDSGRPLDIRRFRHNILIETKSGNSFEEDNWVGRTIYFGEESNAPAVSLTLRDKRCVMVNLDPETSESDANVMKSIVRLNENNAGVYGTVIKTGNIFAGQKIYFSD
ncbi:MAG: MOSC domain-containing protein [Ignavibacteria bacterium]|nr:MOSC domain-containing protein [Ignavibacteria bacterium]